MNNLQLIKNKKNIGICICALFSIYLMFSFYFKNHFLFRTYINGVDVSLKTVDQANKKLNKCVDNYDLKLIERNMKTEDIKGNDINLTFITCNNNLNKIISEQKNYCWIGSFFEQSKYSEPDLIKYDDDLLKYCFDNLACLNSDNVIEPKNPTFLYIDRKYIVQDEIYGNLVSREKLYEYIKNSILCGNELVNLENNNLYEKPKYTVESKEVIESNEKLNKYVSSKIVYTFAENMETVDGEIINTWLNVNDDMEIQFDEEKVKEFIKSLADKYDTVGREREFMTSTGKNIKIKGGNYGFKINIPKEIELLIENIKNGQSIVKEPLYTQKGLCRNGDDDIGNTYVEVNITSQQLWFYKNGKLIISGDVVTGNISRGNGTHLGVYELNYKQKNATLKGNGYSSNVQYWMPFDGNIGLHDASWRNSFGGNIYKSNGTHGCVNLPIYLAKKIFSEIEAGTPIICYTEG